MDTANELVALRAAVQRVELPPHSLAGWQSLVAEEYATAVGAVAAAIDAAEAHLGAAAWRAAGP